MAILHRQNSLFPAIAFVSPTKYYVIFSSPWLSIGAGTMALSSLSSPNKGHGILLSSDSYATCVAYQNSYTKPLQPMAINPVSIIQEETPFF